MARGVGALLGTDMAIATWLLLNWRFGVDHLRDPVDRVLRGRRRDLGPWIGTIRVRQKKELRIDGNVLELRFRGWLGRLRPVGSGCSPTGVSASCAVYAGHGIILGKIIPWPFVLRQSRRAEENETGHSDTHCRSFHAHKPRSMAEKRQ